MSFKIEVIGNSRGHADAERVVQDLVLSRVGRLMDGPTASEYASASSEAIARSLGLDPAEIEVTAEGNVSRGAFGLSVTPASPRAASAFSRFGCQVAPGQ